MASVKLIASQARTIFQYKALKFVSITIVVYDVNIYVYILIVHT